MNPIPIEILIFHFSTNGMNPISIEKFKLLYI